MPDHIFFFKKKVNTKKKVQLEYLYKHNTLSRVIRTIFSFKSDDYFSVSVKKISSSKPEFYGTGEEKGR